MMIEPMAGPTYWARLCGDAGTCEGVRMAAAKALIHGCSAGRGFVYIKPDGRVWPCLFLPLDCGNVREIQFYRIYRDSPVMPALRNRETLLKGRCGRCDFRSVCGGCRGRAFTAAGDPLGEDPACFMPD